MVGGPRGGVDGAQTLGTWPHCETMNKSLLSWEGGGNRLQESRGSECQGRAGQRGLLSGSQGEGQGSVPSSLSSLILITSPLKCKFPTNAGMEALLSWQLESGGGEWGTGLHLHILPDQAGGPPTRPVKISASPTA